MATKATHTELVLDARGKLRLNMRFDSMALETTITLAVPANAKHIEVQCDDALTRVALPDSDGAQRLTMRSLADLQARGIIGIHNVRVQNRADALADKAINDCTMFTLADGVLFVGGARNRRDTETNPLRASFLPSAPSTLLLRLSLLNESALMQDQPSARDVQVTRTALGRGALPIYLSCRLADVRAHVVVRGVLVSTEHSSYSPLITLRHTLVSVKLVTENTSGNGITAVNDLILSSAMPPPRRRRSSSSMRAMTTTASLPTGSGVDADPVVPEIRYDGANIEIPLLPCERLIGDRFRLGIAFLRVYEATQDYYGGDSTETRRFSAMGRPTLYGVMLRAADAEYRDAVVPAGAEFSFVQEGSGSELHGEPLALPLHRTDTAHTSFGLDGALQVRTLLTVQSTGGDAILEDRCTVSVQLKGGGDSGNQQEVFVYYRLPPTATYIEQRTVVYAEDGLRPLFAHRVKNRDGASLHWPQFCERFYRGGQVVGFTLSTATPVERTMTLEFTVPRPPPVPQPSRDSGSA